jgi:hypothetical protein
VPPNPQNGYIIDRALKFDIVNLTSKLGGIDMGVRSSACAAALCAMLVSGCTSLATRTDFTDNKAAVTGVPYSLPMLQYELKVTRSLAQCVQPDTEIPDLKFAVTVEATPHYVAGETYVIDYRDLAGPTKTSAFSMEYQENSNILKSLNASVEDRSGEIISNVVRTAIGIASLAGGIPLPTASLNAEGQRVIPPPTGELVCSPETVKLIEAVDAASAEVEAAATSVKTLTASVDALANRLSALSDADRAELTRLTGLQTKALRTLANKRTALAEATDKVSLVTTMRWPREPDDDAELLQLDEADLRKFEGLLVRRDPVLQGRNLIENRCDKSTAITQCLRAKLDVYVTLARTSPQPDEFPSGVQDPPIQTASSKSPAQGIFVRPPAQGRLLACGAQSQGNCTENGPQLLLRSDDAQIPQLGQLRFLPFRNEAFENNALVVSLTPSGHIAKFEYRNPRAQGEAISASALATVNDIRGFADARAAQREAEATAAAQAVVAGRTEELAAIQFEIDKLQRQKTLNDLLAPPAVSATAAMQAQTAEINARIALLQAMLAEKAAQAALAQ